MTQPDQALSISQILSKFAQGHPLPDNAQLYNDEDFTEIEKLDQFEKLDLAKQLRNDIQEFQNNPPKPKPTNSPSGSSDPEEGDPKPKQQQPEPTGEETDPQNAK